MRSIPPPQSGRADLERRAKGLADLLREVVATGQKHGTQAELLEYIEAIRERSTRLLNGPLQFAIHRTWTYWLEEAHWYRRQELVISDCAAWQAKCATACRAAQAWPDFHKAQQMILAEKEFLETKYASIELPDLTGTFKHLLNTYKKRWGKAAAQAAVRQWKQEIDTAFATVDNIEQLEECERQAKGRLFWLERRFDTEKQVFQAARYWLAVQERPKRLRLRLKAHMPMKDSGAVRDAGSSQPVRKVVGQYSENLSSYWKDITDPDQVQKWASSHAEEWEAPAGAAASFSNLEGGTLTGRGPAPLDGRGRNLTRFAS